MSDNWQTIVHLGPEIILIVAATWIFVVGAFARMRQWWPIYGAVSTLR